MGEEPGQPAGSGANDNMRLRRLTKEICPGRTVSGLWIDVGYEEDRETVGTDSDSHAYQICLQPKGTRVAPRRRRAMCRFKRPRERAKRPSPAALVCREIAANPARPDVRRSEALLRDHATIAIPWSCRSVRISKAARRVAVKVRGGCPASFRVSSHAASWVLRQVFVPPGGLA